MGCYSPEDNTGIVRQSFIYYREALSGNWIETTYGTSLGAVRLIVQHPEFIVQHPEFIVQHPEFIVHTRPITKVMLSEKHIVSVCSEYNHVRTWNVTRFLGMFSTQPGSVTLALLKVISIESVETHLQYFHNNNFDTMGQLWTPSLMSRTSPRRSELVVVHPSADMFPEADAI
ncbi:BTB/POZ domain-containing protein KCTD3 [Lamellibrachia satsuma]|nr:BTB/POZ domain-containing protein KCTD3 [Lamellibrachia satsuma]